MEQLNTHSKKANLDTDLIASTKSNLKWTTDGQEYDLDKADKESGKADSIYWNHPLTLRQGDLTQLVCFTSTTTLAPESDQPQAPHPFATNQNQGLKSCDQGLRSCEPEEGDTDLLLNLMFYLIFFKSPKVSKNGCFIIKEKLMTPPLSPPLFKVRYSQN